jgi:TPR repeat protein
MKASVFVALGLVTVLPAFGQYSARRLTRRVAPQTARPQRSAPAAAPAPAPAAVQPAPQYQAPLVTAPPPPVNPEKVAAQKSKTERDLLAWQKQRAEAGSDNAQYELGVRYLKGDGVDQDEKLGLKWLRKSAKAGNIQAKKKLAELKVSETEPAASLETTLQEVQNAAVNSSTSSTPPAAVASPAAPTK